MYWDTGRQITISYQNLTVNIKLDYPMKCVGLYFIYELKTVPTLPFRNSNTDETNIYSIVLLNKVTDLKIFLQVLHISRKIIDNK